MTIITKDRDYADAAKFPGLPPRMARLKILNDRTEATELHLREHATEIEQFSTSNERYLEVSDPSLPQSRTPARISPTPARGAHRDEGTTPLASAFDAEQAVEKGVKALLVWHAVDVPPRHDLGLLVGLVPAGATVKELNVGSLTV